MKAPIKDAVIRISRDFNFQPEVIFSIIQVESGGDRYAARFEPGFLQKYLTPKKKGEEIKIDHSPRVTEETERILRATSLGLMQVMGQTARENGFQGAYLTELFDIEQNVEVGTRILRMKIEKKDGDLKAGLLAYNGGGDKEYPNRVLNCIEKGEWEYLLFK